MSDKREINEKRDRAYRGEEITVYWKPSACIHASSCYRELIEVFDPGSRPWVNMKGATTERIIETVNLCPTEALVWEWNDESKNEDVSPGHTNHVKYKRPELHQASATGSEPASLMVRIMKDGPIVAEGSFTLINDGKKKNMRNTIVSFCRCGYSYSQPFCDGEHRLRGFTDENE